MRHAQSDRGDGRLHVISEFDMVGLPFKRPNRRIEVEFGRSDGTVGPTGIHADLSCDLTVVQEATGRSILQFASRERYPAAYRIVVSPNPGRFPDRYVRAPGRCAIDAACHPTGGNDQDEAY